MMKDRTAHARKHPISEIQSPNRTGIVLLFAVWFLYLLFLTLHPFIFSMEALTFRLAAGRGRFLRAILYGELVDVLGNVALFLPLGIVGFLTASSRTGEEIRRAFQKIIMAGVVLSAVVESLQLFLPGRSCAVFDVLANVFGTALGFWIWQKWGDAFTNRWAKVWKHPARRFAILAFCVAAVSAILLHPLLGNRLKGWDAGYPMLIGNEAIGGRAWQGRIRVCALYPGSFNVKTIRDLSLRTSESEKTSFRKAFRPLVMYSFEEGKGDTVFDRSGLDPLLPMTGSRVHWLEQGPGIGMASSDSPLRTRNDAGRIVRRLDRLSRFSVELVAASDSADQTGPARIFTMSESYLLRNFTVGQEGDAVVVRVRTPMNRGNGSLVVSRSPGVFSDSAFHHIIFTFANGISKMVVDGKLQKSSVLGNLAWIFGVYNFGRSWPTLCLFCFVLFFPLALAVSGVLGKESVPGNTAVVIGFAGMIEAFLVFGFGKPLDPGFLAATSGTALFGSIFGLVFFK